TGGDGSRDNPTTIDEAISRAVAGDTIWLFGGTYLRTTRILIQKSGTAGAPIRILNVAGEIPIIDFQESSLQYAGVMMAGDSGVWSGPADWWVWRGITIQNVGDFSGHGQQGMRVGGSHCLIDRM